MQTKATVPSTNQTPIQITKLSYSYFLVDLQ